MEKTGVLYCKIATSKDIAAWPRRLRQRLKEAIFLGDERAATIVGDATEDSRPEARGEQQEMLLLHKALSMDLPREEPRTPPSKPSLLRLTDTHVRLTTLAAFHFPLNATLFERLAMREIGKNVTTLVIEGCSLKDEGLAQLSRAMLRMVGGEPVCRVEVLSLGNNYITAKGAQTLATGLQASRTVRRLHMDCNYLGASGAAHLAALLARPDSTLTELDLEANDVRDAGAAALASALLSSALLSSLNLDTNKIRSAGAEALANALGSNSTLRSLSLGGNDLTTGGEALARALLHANASLHRLLLDSSNLSPSFFGAIGEALRGPSCGLTELSVNRNAAGDEGAAMLAQALSCNTALRKLHLASCGMTNEGTRHFLTVVAGVGRLQVLNLDHNQGGGDGEYLARRIDYVTRSRQ